ncbi:MAG: protein phosphatase 2C domain-containing protein [Clostridium sp.]|nr:protein phosphatase 2C domain-containing protein [Clostridium sp.]MCM1207699.1 protein phosphatase 2C domain-containing protein [Ruminococcus sp.]
MKVTYSICNEIGNRSNNEDSVGFYCANNIGIFVVADGLGGHSSGEVASKTVVNSIMEEFKKGNYAEDFLASAISLAQNNVLAMQQKDRKNYDMKTTVVAMMLDDESMQYGYVGDSRLYYFKDGKLKEQSKDHSVPYMMYLSKKIKEKDIRHHEDRNRLLRVIGTEWDEPEYDISEKIKLSANKRNAFLLCTDGFWELITEKEMTKCLKQANDVETWMNEMKKIIQENGKESNMDNYSAIGVFADVS